MMHFSYSYNIIGVSIFTLNSQTLQYSSIQVDSVHKQGYQVAFLASKTGDGDNEILSLHGGLTLNIQKQLEVNFKQLLTGKLHTSYYITKLRIVGYSKIIFTGPSKWVALIA